jgi:hypothetical protein
MGDGETGVEDEREVSAETEGVRVVSTQAPEDDDAVAAAVAHTGEAAGGEEGTEMLDRDVGTHVITTWEEEHAGFGIKACGEPKGDGHVMGSLNNDGVYYYNKLLLIPPLYKHFCLSWVDRWWEELLSLFFAQLLWKMFASLVPYTSSPLAHHDDLFIKRGSKAKSLLLEYTQAVFAQESTEHGVEGCSQRNNHDDLPIKRGSQASLLLLEYPQAVLDHEAMEHGENFVQDRSQRHHDQIEEGGPEIIINQCLADEVGTSGSLPRRKRGRPRRSLCHPPSIPILPSGESLPLSSSGDPLGSEVSGQTSAQPRRGGYYTRAKKTWLMGKLLGLEFPGTDEEAIKGLELDLSTYLPEEELDFVGY